MKGKPSCILRRPSPREITGTGRPGPCTIIFAAKGSRTLPWIRSAFLRLQSSGTGAESCPGRRRQSFTESGFTAPLPGLSSMPDVPTPTSCATASGSWSGRSLRWRPWISATCITMPSTWPSAACRLQERSFRSLQGRSFGAFRRNASGGRRRNTTTR